MRLVLILLAGLCPPAIGFAQTTLDEVRTRAEAGDYAQALDAAEAESDAFLRAQAEVWLYFRARDFRASLAAAQRGLAARGGDPWLLERAAASALHLRDAALADEWTRRFEQRVSRLDASEAEAWREVALERAGEAQALMLAEQRARSALARARWVACLALAATAAACVALGLGLRPARAGKKLPAALRGDAAGS